jgi:hypothetical protein
VQLPGHNKHSIEKFVCLKVPSLCFMEDLADVTPQVLLRESTQDYSLLTHYHMKIDMGKVPQTWNSRS